MVASYDRLQNRLLIKAYNDDNATAATARNIAWVAMQEHFLAICLFTIGTGVLTFRIMAATDSSGTGSTLVRAHATPTTADAPGDSLVLEVSAEEVLSKLADATHVSVEMDNDDNADENAIFYVMEGKRHLGSSAQTADNIS